jgi:Tfp pilus assembly protein PilF
MIRRSVILSFLIVLNLVVTSCSTLAGGAVNHTNAYLDGAKYNLSQNNSSLALESANQAILASPNDFEGYYVAAQAYQQLDDVNNADANYSKSFELNKDLTNLYDFGLSYANFLCVYKLDYNTSYRIYNQSAILAVKNQSSGLMIANIYTSYAGCLSIQDRDDEAISNYILAMGYKDAPVEAYLGISKVYLKEHNYPSTVILDI